MNTIMTKHEREIRDHCSARRICIELLPGGAAHFTGHGVDITTAKFSSITLADLRSYEPRKDHALRNQAMPSLARIRTQATLTGGL